jgi:hypothetical protein
MKTCKNAREREREREISLRTVWVATVHVKPGKRYCSQVARPLVVKLHTRWFVGQWLWNVAVVAFKLEKKGSCSR